MNAAADDGALRLDDDNPWPGLAAYDEASRAFFHGRDDDSAELLRLIRLSPFVTLYGKSGLGKSSMLRAGVFPQLRVQRYLPVYLRLDYREDAVAPPLEQAAQQLRRAIDEAQADAPPPLPGESLWAYLQRRERPIWTADNFPLTPLLVFDQFEELFSRGGSPAHVKRVLDDLADLVGNRLSADLAEDSSSSRRLNLQTQQYGVLLSFRSDFLADVESWVRQASLPNRESLHLRAMTRERAIQAVERAGAAVLQPDVAPTIVDFVLARDEGGDGSHATEVEPVLLSLCCYQLNRRRVRPAKIDAVLVSQVGEHILRDFYNEALAGMPPRVPVFIEDNLIQGGRYRTSFPRDIALASGALTPDELERLTPRLLRIDPQGDVPRIELIHDRLVGIVRDAKEARLALDKQRREHEDALARAAAEREADRVAQATRSGRRFRAVAATLAVLLAILAFFAYTADREQRRANSEATKARALVLTLEAQSRLSGIVPGGDELAFEQLLVAHMLWPGPATQGAMFDALVARQHLARLSPVVVPTGANVTRLAWIPGSSLLATGQEDGWLTLRDAARPADVAASAAAHNGPVLALAASRDGQHLVSGGDDGQLRRWLAPALTADGAPIPGDGKPVYGVAYSPGGGLIASGGDDGSVRFWDAATGAPIGLPVALGTQAVNDVAFSPDGRYLAAVSGVRDSGGSWLTLIDPLGLEQTRSFFAHAEPTLAVAYGPRPNLIVTGGKDDTLRVRDLDGGPLASVRMGGHQGDVLSVAFSPDGRWLASGSVDHTVRLWRADGTPLGLPLVGHASVVSSVAFSPDGRWLASAAEDQTLRLWPLDPGWATGPALLTDDDTRAGRQLLATARGGALGVLLDAEGALWLRVSGLPDQPLAAPDASPVAPDASRPGAASCRQASASPESGQRYRRAGLAAPGQYDQPTLVAALRADGSLLVTARADGRLQRWNLETRRAEGSPQRLGPCPPAAAAWSRDGRFVAVADSEGEVRVFDAQGNLQRTQQGPKIGVPTAVALGRDGHALAIAGPAHTLWLMTDASAGLLDGVPEDLQSLGFSPDGRTLVSGSTRGNVMVWDVATRSELGKAHPAHPSGVAAIEFSADGERFLSVSPVGASRPWPVPARWPAEVCNKLGRNPSRQTWQQLVAPQALPYRCLCPGLPMAADDGGASATCPPAG